MQLPRESNFHWPRRRRREIFCDPWNGSLGGGKGIMVWMGVSLRYGWFIHIDGDSSVKGEDFKKALTKRGGEFFHLLTAIV